MTEYCCEELKLYSTLDCEIHDEQDCPDVLVLNKKTSWGLPVRDGGSSWVMINFCPWCGTELPKPEEVDG